MEQFQNMIMQIIDAEDERINDMLDNYNLLFDSLISNEQLLNEVKRDLRATGASQEDIIAQKEAFYAFGAKMQVGAGLSENKTNLINKIITATCALYDKALEDSLRPNYIIPVELCHPNAKVPTYANDGDAGFDFYLVEDVAIKAGERKIVKTGLKMAVPFGFELQVRPRSGTSLKTTLSIANSPGTVDTYYRDEIGIIAWNTGEDILEFKQGDRIAQGVLNEVPKGIFNEIPDITKIVGTRNGGFGSSGE